MGKRLLAVLLEFCILAGLPVTSRVAGDTAPGGERLIPMAAVGGLPEGGATEPDGGYLPDSETAGDGETDAAPSPEAEPTPQPEETPGIENGEPTAPTESPEGAGPSASPEGTPDSEDGETTAPTESPEGAEPSASPEETPDGGDGEPTAPAEPPEGAEPSASPEGTTPPEGEQAPDAEEPDGTEPEEEQTPGPGEEKTYSAQLPDSGATVTAVLPPEANLPEGALFHGDKIDETSPGYETMTEAVREFLNIGGEGALQFLPFDLYFTGPEDEAERIEPEGGPVQITITYPADPFEEPGDGETEPGGGESAAPETAEDREPEEPAPTAEPEEESEPAPEPEESAPTAEPEEVSEPVPEAEEPASEPTEPAPAPETAEGGTGEPAPEGESQFRELAKPAPAEPRRVVLRVPSDGGVEIVEARWSEDNTSVTFTVDSLSPVGLALVLPRLVSVPIASADGTENDKPVTLIKKSETGTETTEEDCDSLKAAVKKAKDGDTIRLNQDIERTGEEGDDFCDENCGEYDEYEHEGPNSWHYDADMEVKVSITIDLNSHKIDSSSFSADACALFAVTGSATLTIKNGSITGSGKGHVDNDENDSGGRKLGTIYVPSPTAKLILDGVKLENNTSFSGGGVYCAGALVLTGNTVISGNTSTRGGGGGIYLEGASNLTVGNGVHIDKNTAKGSGSGGGIYFACEGDSGGSSTLTVSEGGSIDGNSANQEGGGVFFGDDGFSGSPWPFTLAISGGTISNNTCGQSSYGSVGGGGGGVGINTSGDVTITISGGTIGGNNAGSAYGGGINIKQNGGSLNVRLCDGTNIATNKAGTGGGISVFSSYSAGVTFTVEEGANITGNDATNSGGGLYFDCGSSGNSQRGHIYLKGGKISGNNCVGTESSQSGMWFGHGGGIYIKGNYDLDMTGGDIDGNTAAVNGGGICMKNSGTDLATNCKVTITGGNITNNSCGPKKMDMYTGGGIYVEHYTVLWLKNVIIRENTTDSQIGGGAITSCAESNVKVYLNEGGAIYGNYGPYEVYINKWDDDNHQSQSTGRVRVSAFMLGGGAYNWTDKDGKPVPLDLLYSTDPSEYADDPYLYQMGNSPSPEGEFESWAEALAKVYITGNHNTGNELGGGAIGANGTIIIGTEEDDRMDLYVHKVWNTTSRDVDAVRVWLVRLDGPSPTLAGYMNLDKYSTEPLKFEDLPVGSRYTVIEECIVDGKSYFSQNGINYLSLIEEIVRMMKVGAWTFSSDSRSPYDVTVGEQIVESEEKSDITVTNKDNEEKGKTGGLRVRKVVTGAGDKDKKFPFTVNVFDKSINGVYGQMTFTDGVAAFELKDGEEIYAENLPAGLYYTVQEGGGEEGIYVTSSTGDVGFIPANDYAIAEFTNYKEPGPGGLTVTKTVGDGGDRERPWHFRVELSDTSIQGPYGDMFFTDGVAEFTLKHGESKTAWGLPEGVTYTVTEAEANQEGYSTTKTGDTGTIPGGGNATADFVNDRPGVTLTGDDSHFGFWLGLTGVSALGALLAGLLLLRGRGKGGYRGRHIKNGP